MNNDVKILDALNAIAEKPISAMINGGYDTLEILEFPEGFTKPTKAEIDAKIQELESAEPMRLLRQERNRRLSETDWMSFSDSPTMTDDWRTYRQALRDLPSTAEPQLDENGQLTNVTWPTKPE